MSEALQKTEDTHSMAQPGQMSGSKGSARGLETLALLGSEQNFPSMAALPVSE